MKTREREIARELRRVHGASVREVADAVGVARSTASLWLRDIQLTPEQEAALVARNPIFNGKREGAAAKAAAALERRRAYQEEGRALARRSDVGFAAGCMLFWAEGSRERNVVEFTNSDPEMIAFFASFLRRYFGVTDDEMSIACNLFADHVQHQRDIEGFWLDKTGLPRSSLRKTRVNNYSKYSKKLRKNKLPYGTCRVVVCRTRVVQMIYGAIQELAGFDRPAWAEN